LCCVAGQNKLASIMFEGNATIIGRCQSGICMSGRRHLDFYVNLVIINHVDTFVIFSLESLLFEIWTCLDVF
jgi:hypothetical protein